MSVANISWSTEAFSVNHAGQGPSMDPGQPAGGGRFATAVRIGSKVVLTRDSLGLNKLYFAIHPQRGVVAANYLADLIAAGIRFESIFAVPAGAAAEIDVRARTIRLNRHYRIPTVTGQDIERHLAAARESLCSHIEAAAASHPAATVAVCLSGGLDSGLIAALVRRYFAHVYAYTYSFDCNSSKRSSDALAAEQLAGELDIPFRLVTADAAKVFNVLPRAYRFGQDWRDFNLHCAIVNEILAEAIATDTAGVVRPILVFTGDLMNEFLGDYSSIRYRGEEFYVLPDVPRDLMRLCLVRGLQCGDREVGVFAGWGLLAVQPYAQIADHLLQIPGLSKPDVMRRLAGPLLPAESYERPKARAQIGDPTAISGILPLLVEAGYRGDRLEREFCYAVGMNVALSMNGRIRSGVYQFPFRYPEEITWD